MRTLDANFYTYAHAFGDAEVSTSWWETDDAIQSWSRRQREKSGGSKDGYWDVSEVQPRITQYAGTYHVHDTRGNSVLCDFLRNLVSWPCCHAASMCMLAGTCVQY